MGKDYDLQCFYCTKSEPLSTLMTEVCVLDSSTVYLFHDQKNPGRCVVASNGHKTEIFEFSAQERNDFFEDVSNVAKAIHKLYGADKINYATYGDLAPHFHVHLVPKKVDGVSWGSPFSDTLEKVYLTDEDMNQWIATLNYHIRKFVKHKI